MKREEVVSLLENVAARGFCSEPVPYWLNKDETEQIIAFTKEEKAAVRKFLGENPCLSKLGRHRIGSFWPGDEDRRTMSLLSRISYALSSKHISPEYVSSLAAELSEIDGEPEWQVAELNKMQKL